MAALTIGPKCLTASQSVIKGLYLLIQSNFNLIVLIITLSKNKTAGAALYSVLKSPQPGVHWIRNLVWLCYCGTADSTVDGAS